jgi:hypothetical protein
LFHNVQRWVSHRIEGGEVPEKKKVQHIFSIDKISETNPSKYFPIEYFSQNYFPIDKSLHGWIEALNIFEFDCPVDFL